MGSHRDFHVGVYLVVDQWVEGSDTKRVCEQDHPQRTYSHSDPANFCNICGTPVSDKSFPYKNRVNLEDADELYDIECDTFQSIDQGDNPPIWIGNLTSDNLIEDEHGDDKEITPEYIEAAVASFHRNYRESLQSLDDHNVDYKMHFGALIFYN